MVYISNMNPVMVFPLLLAFISGGCSYNIVTEQNTDSCYTKCPAGFYKVGICDNQKIKCKICGNNTYTEIENSHHKCQRCSTCSHYERTVKRCTFNSDIECDCKEGYYYENKWSCKLCTNAIKAPSNNVDYNKKCRPCLSDCSNDPECKKKCTTTVIQPPATTISTKSVSETPIRSHYIWLIFVVVVFALLSGLLLLRNMQESLKRCITWRTEKVEQRVEAPMLKEQHSHQDITSTTLTLNICEETPMMNLRQNPVTSENPAYNSPEHKAARQDELSKHWPAIVLYAIIKEVPLRRWKEFLRLLSVADEQLERAELEAGSGLSSIERQYQMLRLWSQRPSVSLDDVFSALHYMDLAGCAQLLQENLEKLQWSTESKQGFAACRNYADH